LARDQRRFCRDSARLCCRRRDDGVAGEGSWRRRTREPEGEERVACGQLQESPTTSMATLPSPVPSTAIWLVHISVPLLCHRSHHRLRQRSCPCPSPH
jgi:hypothetical protein